MKKALRNGVVGAVLAGSLLFLAPAPGEAQVRVEGRFRLPHGDVAIGVGDPDYRRGYPGVYYGYSRYPVGSYVPYGYRVIRQPRLGYGFYSPVFFCRTHGIRHEHWIPVRLYGRRYVVVQSPVVVVDRRDDSRGDPYYDFNREYWDRSYHNPYPH
jgi:hypothetical protein